MIGAADPAIAAAIAAYIEANIQAARWQRVCARWKRASGIGVWREGHPSDKEKLRQRRMWRARRRIALNRLADILDAWPGDMERAQ